MAKARDGKQPGGRVPAHLARAYFQKLGCLFVSHNVGEASPNNKKKCYAVQ